MNRVLALALGALLLAGIAASVTATLARDERGSAFVDGSGGAQAAVEAAGELGLRVQRLGASPAALGRGLPVDPEHTLLLVADARAPYTTEEARQVAAWVQRGGVLLVADDFGQGSSLLAPYGVAFERVRLVAPTDAPWPASAGEPGVQPPSPSAVFVGPGTQAETLVASPVQSFLDRDGDGVIGASDPEGAFPFLVRTTRGDGQVLALADADVLTATGAAAGSNRAFVSGVLAKALPDGGLILVDESRAPHAPLLGAMAWPLSAAASTPWRIGLAAFGTLLLLALLLPPGWVPWAAHAFRPDRFVRRTDLLAGSGLPAPGPGGWTRRGAAAALLALALATGAILWGSGQAAVASGALLVALAVASWPRRPAIRATRVLSAERMDEGSQLSVSLKLAGAHASVPVEVQDTLPETFQLVQGSNWFRTTTRRAALEATYEVTPALRGPHAVGPLRVRALDPLRLRADDGVVLAADEVRVNPRREPVRRLPFGTRVPSVTMGPHLVNRAGDGSEFQALRQYQSGDPFRSVNWKASARSPSLMVNQRVHESMTRLVIFLDARAVSAAGPANESPLAHGCRAVLSIAAGALQVRDRLRVVVYGDGATELPPLPGSRQLHALTDLLAGLQPGGATPFGEALEQVLPSLRSGTPMLLASGLEADDSVVDALRKARGHGLRPVVLASRVGLEPKDPGQGGPEPDAQAIAAQRDETVRALQAMGIPVHDAVPNVPLDVLFRLGGVPA